MFRLRFIPSWSRILGPNRKEQEGSSIRKERALIMQAGKKRIPVILDTDLGGDIDDTWALAMLLKSPELDVKLIVSDTGDTTYRLKTGAKLLEIAGRDDIPLGIGLPFPMKEGSDPLARWVEGYDLKKYAGGVNKDGVGAMINTIMKSKEKITLIAIGPVPNIAEALRREPRIAEKVKFVGMHGSVRKGYGGADKISPEYNVAVHTADCQEVFKAGWDMVITPVDTCGMVMLRDQQYQRVRHSKDPVTQALMECYKMWLDYLKLPPVDWDRFSSTLFDTVAVYLAFSEDLLVMEDLGIRVTDDGLTMIDDKAKHMRVATSWKDLNAFQEFLVDRLNSPTVKG